MMYKFIEKTVNLKELPKDMPFEACLLENNEKQIDQICEFLNSANKLLLVNGFKGSGKSQVVNFTLADTLHPQTLLLHYTCLETTILDDMLLGFFQSFRAYTMLGKITPPKIKVENFTQKINSYFNTITNPILIVIDSFDAMVKENKPEVLNFIKHLLNHENVKVIMVSSKAFSSDDFEDITYEKVTTLALSQKIFEKYLKENGIKQIGVLSNELYKLTKGYYNYVNLAAKIINLRQLSLVNFLELYSKSYMAFPEFIIREALSLIDPVSAHLFRLLTVMRIPIHVNLLKSLHLFDENQVSFFVSNSLLSVDGECLFLKDCFREVLENQIPENVMIKLHGACIDLYNTQLPLKPMERDLMLSRQTMRNEIEYHSMFIPKKPIFTTPLQKPLIVEQPKVETTAEVVKQPVEVPQQEETKEEKINKISFIIEDEVVLDNIADSIKDFIVTTAQTTKLEKESTQMSLRQLLNAAKQEEQTYNYKRVVMLYQNALTKTDDEDFYTFLPSIYIKLARAYQNLQDWYEALEYYTQAQDFYINVSDMDKVYEIKLEIANIYYIMYKHDNAKFILSELEKVKQLPNELRIKVNIAAAKLCEDVNLEYAYYQKSLPLITPGTNKQLISELYYKFAAASDEKDDTRTAAEFYKKCIDVDSNPKHNTYLSMALSNLAELYDEVGNSKTAIKYYAESIKIDTAMKNYNGLYGSAIHLAEIYAASDDKKSLEYMHKALEYAKLLKEQFYIAGASLELGDFYFLRADNEHAYRYFIDALVIAKNSFSKDNLEKITSRIDDVKRRIGEAEFIKLQEKYGK